jgi:hypothetical protein
MGRMHLIPIRLAARLLEGGVRYVDRITSPNGVDASLGSIRSADLGGPDHFEPECDQIVPGAAQGKFYFRINLLGQ